MIQSTRMRVLGYIRAYIRRNGYPPSMREIGDGVGLTSLSSVSHQLEKLEDEGFITRNPRIPRSIVLQKEVEGGLVQGR